jgi:hypothetical protein
LRRKIKMIKEALKTQTFRAFKFTTNPTLKSWLFNARVSIRV